MEDNIDKYMSDAGFNKVNPNEVKENEQPSEQPPVEGQQPPADDTPKDDNIKKDDVPVSDEKEKVDNQPEFDLESINKAFGKDFKTVDELTDLFNLPDEYNSVKAKLDATAKDISDKEEALKEKYNPMSYFADEQEFKINQILKNDTKLNKNIVSRLVYSNLDELKDEDVLKLNDLLKTKGNFDEKVVELDIKDRYGLNIDREEADDEVLKSIPLKEYRMKKDADEARDSLKAIKDVELPTFDDPTELKAQQDADYQKAFDENKQKWDTFTKEYIKTFDKLSIKYNADGNKEEVFDFDIDDKFKNAVLEHLPIMAAKNGKDLSNENDKNALLEQVQKDFLWINKGSVIKKAIEDTLSKMTKEEMEKYYNPSKPKQEEGTQTLSKDDEFNQGQIDKMKQDFGIK